MNLGLAVRSFVMFNNALLGKWLWKFELERDALWCRVIVKKYGSEGGGGLLSGLVGGPYGVSLWKYIRKGWETFSQFLEFKVGDGSRIHSWSDVWCGLVPLKASFPELFRITRDKEAYVANHLQVRNEGMFWEMDFLRLFHDWELESMTNFLDLIYSVSLIGQGGDQLCWKPPVQRFSKFVCIILFCLLQTVCCFHGNVFGSRKPRRELFSLYGRWRWGRF